MRGSHSEDAADCGSDYLTQELIPSYFELETQVFPEGGHVLRFDSFSKLLSAGLRLVGPFVAPYDHTDLAVQGYATGPKEILHAIDVTTAGTLLSLPSNRFTLTAFSGACLHTSSVSQAVAYRLLAHCTFHHRPPASG